MKSAVVAVLLVITTVMPAGAQLNGEWMADNLATDCAPMGLELVTYGDVEDNDALRRTLRNATESRLRAAGIFNAAGWEEHRQSLDVRVGTNGVASSLELILYRFVMDTGYGQAGPMLAWNGGPQAFTEMSRTSAMQYQWESTSSSLSTSAPIQSAGGDLAGVDHNFKLTHYRSLRTPSVIYARVSRRSFAKDPWTSPESES